MSIDKELITSEVLQEFFGEATASYKEFGPIGLPYKGCSKEEFERKLRYLSAAIVEIDKVSKKKIEDFLREMGEIE